MRLLLALSLLLGAAGLLLFSPTSAPSSPSPWWFPGVRFGHAIVTNVTAEWDDGDTNTIVPAYNQAFGLDVGSRMYGSIRVAGGKVRSFVGGVQCVRCRVSVCCLMVADMSVARPAPDERHTSGFCCHHTAGLRCVGGAAVLVCKGVTDLAVCRIVCDRRSDCRR